MGPEDPIAVAAAKERIWNGVLLPDLSTRISEHAREMETPIEYLPQRDVNAACVRKALEELDSDLVVYSGVGGQIVSAETLASGPQFLHMHSGWLPEYRGSTTLYYAILNGEAPGVSAINLDPGIDTGPILARQKYPLPDAGMDVDTVYDSAIRADMMCRVMADYPRKEDRISQMHSEGTTYFVIHPVLKHLALLSLRQAPQ